MKKQQITGWLLIAGAAGVLIPYTILSGIFRWKWQPVGESNPSYLVENQVS